MTIDDWKKERAAWQSRLVSCRNREELSLLFHKCRKYEQENFMGAEFFAYMAEISHQMEDQNTAIRYMRKALKYESERTEYYARLCLFCFFAESDEALNYLKMLEQNESYAARLVRAWVLLQKHQFQECLCLISEGEKKDEYSYDRYTILLPCMEGMREPEAHVKRIWEESGVYRESKKGQSFYMSWLYKSGQYEECRKYCKKLIVKNPNAFVAQEAHGFLKKLDKQEKNTEKKVRELPEECNLFDALEELIGLTEVKEQMRQIYRRIRYEKFRQERLGVESVLPTGHYIFTGNPGTGKTTVARILCGIFYEMGLLATNHLIETDRSGLVGQYVGETTQKTRKLLEKAKGGMLFIDEAYALYRGKDDNDFGREAIDTLIKEAEDSRNQMIIVMAGYEKEMEILLKANPGLESRFQNRIHFPDYTNEELLQIAEKIADKRQYTFSEDAKKAFLYCIERERVDERFGNARTVRNLMEEVFTNKANIIQINNLSIQDMTEITEKDFGGLAYHSAESLEDYTKELHSLIGLEQVKREIDTFVKVLRYHRQELECSGKEMPSLCCHMAFMGNPGTGKTTVARLLGRMLKELGVLKRGQLLEVSRADLVGQWSGHTAEKTLGKCREAYGGILFIDEAYSLVHDSHDSFGREAVDTLIKEMEDNRDKLMVILAGYSEPMKLLFASNPGFESRISKKLVFDDYREEELMDIFKHFMKEDGFSMEQEEALQPWISAKYQLRSENFGNAREVRKWYEQAKENLMCRVVDHNLTGKERKIFKTEDLT